jgi:hypothetical protein
MKATHRIELDTIATERGAVKGLTQTLQQLALLILGIKMNKESQTRLSNWSAAILDDGIRYTVYCILTILYTVYCIQLQYAADAFLVVPGLTQRLKTHTFVDGFLVDIQRSYPQEEETAECHT